MKKTDLTLAIERYDDMIKAEQTEITKHEQAIENFKKAKLVLEAVRKERVSRANGKKGAAKMVATKRAPRTRSRVTLDVNEGIVASERVPVEAPPDVQ